MTKTVIHTDRPAVYLERLDRLLSLSERMMDLARAGRWAALAEAQDERQAVIAGLEQIGALELSRDDARVQLIRIRLQAILELNTEMTEMGYEAHRALSRAIRTISDGRNARRAYLENNG